MMLVRYSLAAKALATCLMATPAWAPGLAAPAQAPASQGHAVAAAAVPTPTAAD